ncbi:hypothetical protein B0H19DRAFT_1073692 [Mycena capillaripes]|nr:hypothetical protein B0H19DRAFT_1073692 [Mycena capillaripes]
MALPFSSVIQASVALQRWELTTACATGRLHLPARPRTPRLRPTQTYTQFAKDCVGPGKLSLGMSRTYAILEKIRYGRIHAAPHCHLPGPVYDHRLWHPHKDVWQRTGGDPRLACSTIQHHSIDCCECTQAAPK